MQYTENLKLRKPESTDFYSIEDFNENTDILESAIGEVAYGAELAMNKASTHISNKNNPHGVTKAQIGLDKVDNTADLDKPVSILQQNALDEVENKGKITDIATGERITLTNSADAPARSLRIDGKTEQFTTTGKNLLENIAVDKTTYGLTFKVNDDRSVTVNGTAEENIYYEIGNCENLSQYTNYVLTGCPNNGSQSTYMLYVSSTKTNIYDIGKGFAFSNENGKVLIKIGKGVTVNNLVFKPMIRLVSITDSTYEPYTGGTASPNPDFPQDIRGIGESGDVEVTVTGKNIFDISKALVGSFDSNGDYKIGHGTQKFYEYAFKENIQYTFSGYVKNENPNGAVRFKIFYTDGTSDNMCLFHITTEYIYLTYTSAENKTISYISAYYSTVGYMYIKNGELQIEQGTVATEYEPYKLQTVQIPIESAFLSVPTLYDGDTAIVKDGGIDYVRHYETVVFDGSDDENWERGSTTTSGKYLFKIAMNGLGNTNPKIYADKLKSNTFIELWNCNNSIAIQSNSHIAIYFEDTSNMNVTDFKTWLSKNPITVVYELAEPKIETLNKDIDLSTYSNVTHISNSEDANMEVEYFTNSPIGIIVKDLQEQVNNTTSYLNDFIVVENFEINGSGVKIQPNDRYDIELPVNKDGYIPVMATLSFDTDPIIVSLTGCKILGNKDTGYYVFGKIFNLETIEIQPLATVTVLYVKAQ